GVPGPGWGCAAIERDRQQTGRPDAILETGVWFERTAPGRGSPPLGLSPIRSCPKAQREPLASPENTSATGPLTTGERVGWFRYDTDAGPICRLWRHGGGKQDHRHAGPPGQERP